MYVSFAFAALLAMPAAASAHNGVVHGTDEEAAAHEPAAVTMTAAEIAHHTGTAARNAGDASREQIGRIYIDAGRNGEAWYVNPQSYMRVYLGRPDEAVERLSARGIFVNYLHVERLAAEIGGAADHAYGAAVAGYVLTPSDLVGASWYVHPDTHVRMRIATPADALAVMRTGTPVPSAVIDAIAIEPEPAVPATGETAVVSVDDARTLTLSGATAVRLLSVETPANADLQAAAKKLLTARIAEKPVRLSADVKRQDRDGTPMRYARAADGTDLSYELIRNGLAFPSIEFPNYKHAEMFIVASIDAKRLQRGFWSPTFQTIGRLD